MPKKEFHTKHSSGTKTKLEIFDKYFNECLPVFVYSSWGNIYIYDLFAGKGKDEWGDYGTSLNIIKGVSSHCESIAKKKKNIFIVLNDKDEHQALKQNVDDFLTECSSKCSLENCILSYDKNLIIKGNEFKPYFDNTIFPNLSKKKNSAKIIFLDPFNFVMNDELFGKLISLKATDFICFMPSSYLRRFKNTPAFNTFIDKGKLTFDTARPNECHRVIARYFDTLVSDKDYYIGHFSIKYDKNIYGVVFGTNHTLGAEKFQKVCWEIDNTTGEADYNIDREKTYKNERGLFVEDQIPQKIKLFDELLTSQVKEGKIRTDVDAYKLALKNRCLPKHAGEVLCRLMDEKKINPFKTERSGIHKIKNPINIIYHETV
jgi:three-Cys-motif partner protein